MADKDVFKGFLLGIAAAALVPVVRKALGERSDSLARAASRAAGAVGEKAREVAVEFTEIAEDTIVELQRHGSPASSDTPSDAEVTTDATVGESVKSKSA